MAIETITKDDPRFALYGKGRNGRFPPTEAEGVSRLEFCDSTADVAEAVERLVKAGVRPTVRSGGHCYEDFVYTNPNGAVIDMNLFSETSPVPGAGKYRIGSGVPLATAYTDLYKRDLVTIPGGTCGTVGAGGHISGGGYGYLSRLHGVTSDWVSAVDIVTVDHNGKAMARRATKKNDPDLLRACRGAGGGNFGIITNYYFDELPPVPKEVIRANITFAWEGMTEENFAKILNAYGNYWETRGKDRDTWGMFTIFGIGHRSSGHFGMGIQFCNPDGTCNDLKPLIEFMDLFNPCNPVPSTPENATPGLAEHLPSLHGTGEPMCVGQYTMTKHHWLEANVQAPRPPATAGGNANRPATPQSTRAKYKSSYMKRAFTPHEIATIYKHMNRTMPGVDLRRCTLSTDSYGGATNRKELLEETSVAQRESVMKLQFLTYWTDPAQDEAHFRWIDDFYTELYTSDEDTKHPGTPFWGDRYEGCYINYPDKDMLRYTYWTELYYGTKGLYPFLQSVKKRYDPNNIFHHAMSIRS